MKRAYLLLLFLITVLFVHAQSVIATVDRPNIIGPTDTGNDPSITSSGLVRGSGVNIRIGGSDFSSRGWNGSSLSEAITNNDFVQWTISSNESFEIEISELDIRLRANSQGPLSWQILYSLDGFSTSGIPIGTAQSTPLTETDFNINGLNINSGVSGTITFRLYAWGPSVGSGWLRFAPNAAWSDFGISNPGIRIWGDIEAVAPNDIESNIISGSFNPDDNIDYTLYSATSGLTTTNSIKIGEFVIQDGGDDLTDTDLVSTFLTDVGFDIEGSANIAALAIFDGPTNLGETSTITDTAIITDLNGGSGIEALDESSKTFDVYATFNNSVTDNEQIQLFINLVMADITNGSGFESFNAGGAFTPINADDNRIEVIASTLSFAQQPQDGNQFEIMTPTPIIYAVDSNDNLDLDASGNITILSAGSLDGAPLIYPITNGISELNSLSFNEKETDITLFALGSGALGFIVSNPFNINGPLFTIALQDFDGSNPNWSYTNDTPFFDNGWSIDGYYGLIDIMDAPPLSNVNFSGNVLGENDLDDEGENGTSGLATTTFATIDLTSFNDVSLSFDWEVVGYNTNTDDLQYELIYDGIDQGVIVLHNGSVQSDNSGQVKVDIPNSVSSLGLKVSISNNGLTGYSGFDNFKLTSVFEGLLYTNNSWTPNAPSDSTNEDDVLILDGSFIVGSNIVVNNFYIAPEATTIVSLGQSITTEGSVVNNGTLEMNSASSSYSSLISFNTVHGEVVYNRYVNQFADTGTTTGNNDLISAPVTGPDQDFLAFRTANPDLPSGTIGGTLSYLFGPFDNDANEYVNWTGANDSDPIESGIGYRTASNTVSGSTFVFTGNVTTSADPVSIDVGTGNIFNLVGNPYPSYITLSGFLAANSSEFDPLFSGVYGYDGDATDGFQIWNQAYSDANPGALIAPGQGFMISSQVGGGSISFPASIRSIGTADDFIAGRMANPNIAHVKLKLSNSNRNYFTNIYFNENASTGFDSGYDSAVFDGSAPDFAIYSQLVQDNNGIDLGVQSVNYSDLNNVIIPLGINANAGEQITIEVEEISVPEGIEVYLEDTLTNTFTLLNSSAYIFTPQVNLSGIGRFNLRFNEDSLSNGEFALNDLNIYVDNTNKQIVIAGKVEPGTTAELYDIQGRLIQKFGLNSSELFQEIATQGFNSGVYIIKLNSNLGNRTQKLIIK